jgi:hypothetical protein
MKITGSNETEREPKQSLSCLLMGMLMLSCLPQCSGTSIPVKHREGVSHGFIVLCSREGRKLATGDMIQTIEGERVTSEVVLHFKDGSVHNETTVFSQDREFRLISEHLRQYAGQAVAKVDVCTVVTSFSENSIFCHVQTDMTGQFDLHPLPLKTLGIFARKMVDGYPHSIPRREPRRSSSQRRIRSLAWWSTLGATKVF